VKLNGARKRSAIASQAGPSKKKILKIEDSTVMTLLNMGQGAADVSAADGGTPGSEEADSLLDETLEKLRLADPKLLVHPQGCSLGLLLIQFD
jgi:hypothetical protein